MLSEDRIHPGDCRSGGDLAGLEFCGKFDREHLRRSLLDVVFYRVATRYDHFFWLEAGSAETN